jgi:hypothetical protein
MKFNLMTFNVRGLNKESALNSLRLYVHDFLPRLDLLAIQKHERRRDVLSRIGPVIWRSASFWGLEANPGHSPDEDEAGCGGVATFLIPQWTRLISSIGSLFDNRVHCVILAGLPSGDLGITNIYAPNFSSQRCALWKAIAQELPTTCRWVLMGDFNMVEACSDKNRPYALYLNTTMLQGLCI